MQELDDVEPVSVCTERYVALNLTPLLGLVPQGFAVK